MERSTQFAPKSTIEAFGNFHSYLLFNVQPTHHISNIRLTSEASKIEVFIGDGAEYLSVIFGQLLDQVDDLSVYLFEIPIPSGVDKVSLKVLIHFFSFNTFTHNIFSFFFWLLVFP